MNSIFWRYTNISEVGRKDSTVQGVVASSGGKKMNLFASFYISTCITSITAFFILFIILLKGFFLHCIFILSEGPFLFLWKLFFMHILLKWKWIFLFKGFYLHLFFMKTVLPALIYFLFFWTSDNSR